jgi:hypothetical protein
MAKKNASDPSNYDKIQKEAMELFDDYLKKKGKKHIIDEIDELTVIVRNTPKKSKKSKKSKQ